MANKKSIKGTQTEKNLVAAFIGESQTYTRYIYYAAQAEKENLFPIQKIFEETAANELHHGKIFMKMLEGGVVTIKTEVDSTNIGDTAANLAISIKEEREEGMDFYLASAKTAEKEGFPEIARHFEAIASIEKHHMERFERYLKRLQDGTLWKREKPIKWECLVCGYIYEGTEPPKNCPGCDHPYQHYFALDMD